MLYFLALCFLCFLVDSGMSSAIIFSNIASSWGFLFFTSGTPSRHMLDFLILSFTSLIITLFIFVSFGHCAAFWVTTVDTHPSLLIPSSPVSNLLFNHPLEVFSVQQRNIFIFWIPIFKVSLFVSHCSLLVLIFVICILYFFNHFVYICSIFGIWQFQDLLFERWRNSKYVFCVIC